MESPAGLRSNRKENGFPYMFTMGFMGKSPWENLCCLPSGSDHNTLLLQMCVEFVALPVQNEDFRQPSWFTGGSPFGSFGF